MRCVALSVLWVALAACAGSSGVVRSDRSAIGQIVAAAAQRHGVEQSLILGVIQVESSFNVQARSHVGARGLMQLMPKTAKSLAQRLGRADYEIADPDFNINAGTYYLALLLRMFDGDESLALAAYNTGPGRVRRWQRRGRPLAGYSKRYVAAVQKARSRFRGGGPLPEQRESLDRAGLRRLLKRQLYGHRPDTPLLVPMEPPLGG